MIHNDQEYRIAVERMEQQESLLAEQERALREMGLDDEACIRALDPVRSFHAQLKEEIAEFERLRRGIFDDLHNLNGLGHLLVAARIATMSQRELAERLGVDPSQVSRDERNEYRNVTLERARRILDALGVDLVSTVARVGPNKAG
ncbi:MAG: helix-turn-helix domain-containing protein [Phycisphaerales bacterium]